LRFAAKELRADKEVALAAVRQRGLALADCAKELQYDREVVLAAVAQNGWELNYVPVKMRDKEVVLTAMASRGDALEMAPEALRGDREVVLTAVRQNGGALEHASMELRSCKDVVLAAVMRDGEALEHAAAELQADKDVALEAGRQTGLALNHASQQFFVDAALWQEVRPLVQDHWVFRVSTLSGSSCYVVAAGRHSVFNILLDVSTKLDIYWGTGCYDSHEKFKLLRGSAELQLYNATVSWWDLPESEKGTIIDLTLLVLI
ncbi:unnamed protein product, partial [Symbiodinium pilosum]